MIPLDTLAPRQYEIAIRLLAGQTRPVIAASLGIGAGTVKWHVRELYRRLGIHSRAELEAQLPPQPGFPTQPCRQCGREFVPFRRGHRFCSPACEGRQRRGPARDCGRCGRRFTAWTRRTTYCSRSWAANARTASRQRPASPNTAAGQLPAERIPG